MLIQYLVLVAAILSVPSCASSPLQADWVFPQSPDETSTLYEGSTYTLSWTSHLASWFSYFCQDCDTSAVQLWVMPQDQSIMYQVSRKLSNYLTIINEHTNRTPSFNRRYFDSFFWLEGQFLIQWPRTLGVPFRLKFADIPRQWRADLFLPILHQRNSCFTSGNNFNK